MATETEAQAHFTWHVTFNDVGKALSGKTTVTGTGDVIFGKQPDGQWVVANITSSESRMNAIDGGYG